MNKEQPITIKEAYKIAENEALEMYEQFDRYDNCVDDCLAVNDLMNKKRKGDTITYYNKKDCRSICEKKEL